MAEFASGFHHRKSLIHPHEILAKKLKFIDCTSAEIGKQCAHDPKHGSYKRN